MGEEHHTTGQDSSSQQPDVEESPEPPICGFNEQHTHQDPYTTKRSAKPESAFSFAEGNSSPANLASVTSAVTENQPQSWAEDYKYAHTFTGADIARTLDVDLRHGLTSTEAAERLRRDGPNKVEGAAGLSMWKIFLRQISNSLTLVLVIVMGISFGINDYIEGGVVTAVILLNVVVGFVQDYKAEKTIMSLYALSAPECKVTRDGQTATIKAENLVVGDIVQVHVGDVVPADLRLFDGMNAATDEALLTGESLPVSKTPHETFATRDIPIGDRTNMAYSASTMSQGRATGIVVSTGMNTEVGKIAALLRRQGTREQSSSMVTRLWTRFTDSVKTILGLVGTPLTVKLSKFALLLFALAILLAIIVFSSNLWDISDEVLIYGICVAVAVIPESLIAVLTITVAVGTKAMAKGNVIVRKLQALEAVGGVTNICSDKTGTLTQGKMIARKAWIPGAGMVSIHDTTNPFDPTSGFVKINDQDVAPETMEKQNPLKKFLDAIALCNLSQVTNDDNKSQSDTITFENRPDNWKAVGEPTEIALQVLAMRFDSGKPALLEDGSKKLLTEYPFDSICKRMTVVYRDEAARVTEAFMKGATEVIIPILSSPDQEKEEIRSMAESMAGEGLRVLCIATKAITDDDSASLTQRTAAESNLDFIGLVGLYDPPRLETADAVKECQMAGITVHMLTGDHIRTATAIAHEVGILKAAGPNGSHGTAIMAAADFDKLSDGEIDRIETLPLVLARCSPTTKVRMVEAMHRRKAFCVMTGDGVNDSPALKRADVGIAMGLNGSDVAKEAADMVLTDDNFASIVKAVEEGRRLFDNIQKFLMHLLISNISQVILLLIGLAFKDNGGDSTFPLSPLEILWVNLITSSFLALGLGLEEGQPDIMLRPPHDLRIGVFTWELITDKMIYGFFMGSLCLVAFVSVAYGAGGGDLGDGCNEAYNATCDTVFRARATTYSTLTFLLLVTAWEVKHFSRSLFNFDPARNSGPFSVFPTIWRNRFLFWAVVAGFTICFPVVYLPVVNREVFKHQGIGWEWGVVLGCLVVYVALVESWKAVKRRFGIWSGRNRLLTVEDAEMRAGLELTSSKEQK
ncbi:potassium/sodium efflux P-type ATPase, fungal-type [Coniosporium apollinis CBS 100218]|uniref:P-type Na(+) transporter n=1 Tax=Coniosporium apollinis (strain CBS 100218) TaxID=1168221 RepID=R7Z4Y3_CONA1|nr:potassium/sodium efflux P-type ATPase, fungal-type [Coniosporium apollinis CBS 100218]EON69069.1 potassium/sodium efflux P-type ATPase, fungal-type [Coniosporium apollinis CBS 100218]